MTKEAATLPHRPMVLCILDGWGHSEDATHNAIKGANIPVWDRLEKTAPMSLLNTSGEDVGLPKGQMGNSEVGHMNIGSGRIVMQDLPRIDAAMASGALAGNTELVKMIEAVKQTGGACHIAGLVSDGGVHAHIDHIIALAKIVDAAGVKTIIHSITDGRDTPPQSAEKYIAELMEAVSTLSHVTIGTVSGRYYAMDRDNRWERVQLAYDAMVLGKGNASADPLVTVRESYAADKNDEFILPTVMDGYAGMRDGDAFLMANFRADRARQILNALLDPAFDGFERERVVDFAAAAGMVEYSKAHTAFMTTLFASEELHKIFGEILAENGLTQLRISETEKYAHVTFFFNGGKEDTFDGEKRILVPSPDVATYDLKPEMSAAEVTDNLVEAIESDVFDVIVVNYANTDMVGHTGIEEAAIKAVEAVDACLGRLEVAVKNAGGLMFVTADHGNAETMVDPKTHVPHTAHTLNPVPFILVGRDDISLKNGRLCDIAPTMLALMNLPQPKEMTGKSLVA
jgi:2,3-bisphosphoglycerate-independent phosphoglycerate mutase